MKKYSNKIVWLATLLLSIYELVQFQFTGCVHTFRGTIMCNSSAAAGFLLIGAVSIIGILFGTGKKKK